VTDEYDGATLIDGTGERIGTVERTYVDDSGTARLLAVQTGTLLHKHHLVPADNLSEVDGGLQIPWPKEAVEESPAVDATDTVEGETLSGVREYYAGLEDDATGDTATSETAAPSLAGAGADTGQDLTVEQQPAPAEVGQIRDLGDVVEIPIVEEVLVKKPVVREVLRVRKSRETESGIAAADVRREHVEIVSGQEHLTDGADSET
jgi:hypothetical protein